MPDVDFGEWLPDQANVQTPGMRSIVNVIPTMTGYRWFPSSANLNMGALESPCIGAARGTSSGGVEYSVAGTATKLWLSIEGSEFADESIAAQYALPTSQNWGFTQYGEHVFGFNGGVPQFFSLTSPSSLTFDDIDNGPGVPVVGASTAKVGMVFQDFLVLGNIQGRSPNDTAIGVQEGGVHWSGQGTPFEWPLIGTADAANAQSDFQSFAGDGGEITAMVPAGEYALIFRERQIWRMDYVGPPLVFAFRKLDDRRGCVAQNAAIAIGGLVYFPSDDGFRVCDGSSVRSIGHEKVDRTWRDTIDFDKLERVSVAHDSRIPAIYWTVPGASTDDRIPGVLGYQYEIGRWFPLDIPAEWLQTVIETGSSMDEVVTAPTYGLMDMDVDSPTGLGDVEMSTLDSADVEVFAAWLADHTLYAYDEETALPGVLVTGDYELPARSLLRWVRPVLTTDGVVDVQAQFSGRFNPMDDVVYKAGQALNSLGIIPTRVSGRYIRGLFYTSGRFDQMQGFDFTLQERGGR